MNGKNIVKITVTTIVDRIGLVTSMLFLSTKGLLNNPVGIRISS